MNFKREKVVELYSKTMNAYFRDRDKISPSNLVEVKMADFVQDIPLHLKRIYEKFEMGDFSRVSSRIEKYLAENPGPERKPHPPTEETIRLVDQYASDIVQRLGYSGNRNSLCLVSRN